MPRVLNVGGGNKNIPLPPPFVQGWEHVLLDIDPAANPDVCLDARELRSLEGEQFDAIYCSHNLEHYYQHEVPEVLAGFRHLLKPSGFVQIRVPDVMEVMKQTLDRDLDIEEELYLSAGGGISVHDVLYGWGKQLAVSGNDFYAHKMGFSSRTLSRYLKEAGFGHRIIARHPRVLEIQAYAFLEKPEKFTLNSLGIDFRTG